MPKQGEICVILEDCVVMYDDSQETRNTVFDKLIEWYFEHKEFSGEGIMRCNDALMDAPRVLADIVDDIIKFDVTGINNENNPV